MERLFLRRDGGFLKDWTGGDVHTKEGIIKAELIERGGLVKLSKGDEYLIMTPTMRDRIQHMRKGARPIYEYDAGMIAALLSVEKDSVVLEAGTGSGCVTLVLANIAKKVETFEKEERFYDIAKENVAKAGLKNVAMTNKDLLEAELGEYDAVFLDMKDPVPGIEKATPHLKLGRFICVFTPIMDDIKPIYEALERLGYAETRIIQLDTKELEVKKYLRVKGLFGFPGFLLVARKFV